MSITSIIAKIKTYLTPKSPAASGTLSLDVSDIMIYTIKPADNNNVNIEIELKHGHHLGSISTSGNTYSILNFILTQTELALFISQLQTNIRQA